MCVPSGYWIPANVMDSGQHLGVVIVILSYTILSSYTKDLRNCILLSGFELLA